MSGKATTGLVLFLVWSALVSAQEVKFLDLSSVQQRTELRFPPAPPPNCADGQHCVAGGFSGFSVADGALDRRDPHALGVSLDSVAPTDITLEPFEAEFRVLNTGLAVIDIPVSPHLSDLQPADESQSFDYLSLALVVDLRAIGPVQAMGMGYVELYGSTDHPETIINLKPGQWVRVKVKVKLHTWPHEPVDNAELRGNFWLRRNIYSPHAGGNSTAVTNLYPNRTEFPGIAVHFSPTHSEPQQSSHPER